MSGGAAIAAILSRLDGRRATWIEIDLDALAHNFGTVATTCGGRPVWPVVKADAYGHGAVPCARALEEAGASGFVVALAEEGVALRRGGVRVPILLSGPLPVGGAAVLVENALTPSVSDEGSLAALQQAAERAGAQADYQIEIDTGMARLGVDPAHLDRFLAAAGRADRCRPTAVLSHLASVSNPGGPEAREQKERFVALAERVSAALGRRLPRHLASSPALFGFSDAFLDAVRPGMVLFGVRPDPVLVAPVPLRPVLAFRTTVVLTRDLPAGGHVGYEGSWRANRPTRIAVVAAGYADGLRRDVAGRAEALVGGRRRPYVGLVNMDLAQVEIGAGALIAAGEPVTLIGPAGDDAIPVEELVRRTGRTAYEWLTGLGARVPRVLLSGGRPIGVYTPAMAP